MPKFPTLGEFFAHPHNNTDDNIILGVFASSDNTYPVLLKRVIQNGDRFIGTLLHCKWGYPDTAIDAPFVTSVYSDDGLELECSEYLPTLDAVNRHRWKPSNTTYAMPVRDVVRYFPLKQPDKPRQLFRMTYTLDTDTDYDDKWIYTVYAYCLDEDTAVKLVKFTYAGAEDISVSHVLSPEKDYLISQEDLS